MFPSYYNQPSQHLTPLFIPGLNNIMLSMEPIMYELGLIPTRNRQDGTPTMQCCNSELTQNGHRSKASVAIS